MRLANLYGDLVAVFLPCVFLFTGLLSSEETFPFTAYVANDRTRAHSGPGDEYYATDELSRGEPVEIYQRVDGGWLAIKPPPSSFSWLAERDVQRAGNSDVAEVVGSATVSWIGSNLSEVPDHHWLVKLDRGESVTVLGRERFRVVTGGRSELFCKIAPPSGEFRWLHEDDVVGAQEEVAAIRDPNVAMADFRVALQGSPRAPARDDSRERVVDPSRSDPSRSKSPIADGKKDSFVPRDKLSTSSRGSMRELAMIPKRGGSSTASAKTDDPPKISLSGDPETQLRELDLQLSLVVAKPVEMWNFTALRASAEQLGGVGQSTLDRARVQLYLDKLAEFEGLKSRHALMAPKALPTGPLPKLSAKGAKPASDSTTDPRFDGTGWLLPVHSSKKASPPYALLDQDGNILQFVSPSPGLNLNRYLRKEIGIIGQKDQPPALEKPHLTAHRVIELDRHRK